MDNEGKRKAARWHDGFTLAVELTLRQYKRMLKFGHEIVYRNQSLRVDQTIDFLDDSVSINHPIARIYVKHNVTEYKSDDEECGPDEFLKTLVYAILYRSFFGKIEFINGKSDITYTIYRYDKPVKLLKVLTQFGYQPVCQDKGVYVLKGSGIIAGQVIVGEELADTKENQWLRLMHKNMSVAEAVQLIKATQSKDLDEEDQIKAHNLLDIVSSGNICVFEKAKKRCESMGYGGIEQVFKPEIDAAVRKAVEKERKERDKVVDQAYQNILQCIRKLIKAGVSDEMLYEAFKKSDVDEVKKELGL